MATYVIGDVQGCYNEMIELLRAIHFNSNSDTLWFTGDLVNRGPNSLKVLEFVSKLPKVKVILGNHDLHLLAIIFANRPLSHHDTIYDVLKSSQREKLAHWLRHQPLIYYDEENFRVLVHAGIHPYWNIEKSLSYAKEVESILRDGDYKTLLNNIYGNEPNCWDDKLKGWERIRLICHYFTRMRFCDLDGCLDLETKDSSEFAPLGYLPWFKIPNRKLKEQTIFFGHWAAINGQTNEPNCIALDTGCVWGNTLTAYCLETKKLTSVKSHFNFSDFRQHLKA